MPGEPKGVVVVCTDPQGEVVATVTDFHRDKPGGFTLREAQSSRARHAINLAVCNAYCSPIFAQVFSAYDLDHAMRKLRDKGWKITEIPIGHGGNDAG